MNNPYFTIIIPVYNTEKYLPSLFLNLRNIEFHDFEVIIVNDGSTDNSKAICENVISTDSRFKLINQTNAGFGPSRNSGLLEARGQWVLMIDSDDEIHQDALSKLYKITNSDFSIDAVLYGYNKEFVLSRRPSMVSMIPQSAIKDSLLGPSAIPNLLIKGFGFAVWEWCFSRAFLVELKHKFPDFRREADIYWLLKTYGSIKRFKVLSEVLYTYRSFPSVSKLHPNALVNHKVLFKALNEFLDLIQTSETLKNLLLAKYFTLWFCHVVPTNIVISESTSKSLILSELKTVLTDRDLKSISDELNLSSHAVGFFERFSIKLFRISNVTLLYYFTLLKLKAKHFFADHLKKAFYRG